MRIAAQLTRPNTKRRFTIEDDEMLILAVNEIGTNNWDNVAKLFPNMNPRQVRDRYNNYANPSLDKSDFKPEEIDRLYQLREKYGNNWSEISKQLPNRSANQIKNFFKRRLDIAILNKNRIIEGQKSSSQTHTSTTTNALPNSCCSETIDSIESTECTASTDIETPMPIFDPDAQDFYEMFEKDFSEDEFKIH